MQNLIVFIILLIAELAYFRIADRYNIIDKPNARSSHSVITIRGGGIIFPVAMIVACIIGDASLLFTIAVFLVAAVSFIDDIKPLHQMPRFLSHLIAVLLILYDLGFLENDQLWIPVIIIGAIGWMNAFNFMDGINGITVLFSLVSVGTFAYMFKDSDDFNVLVIMGLACLVFAFFNVRKKAKTFAGDVGSISMALFLAYFMTKLIFREQQIAYIMFFSVYAIDAIITILYRLKNRENIFEPHRSHLYQYLANEYKWPHVKVSAAYAVVQLMINVVTVYMIDKGIMHFWIFVIFGLALMGIYLIIRIRVKKSIEAYA